MKDRATLRSDLSAVPGLRGVICRSLLFSYNATSYDYFLETKAINLGGQGAEPPELLSGVTHGSGYMPVVMNS